MNFPSIDIQGSVLSADLLGKIRSEQASFQQGKDFKPEFNNAKLKDEISLAWQEAKGQWTIFQSKLKRLKEGDTGATETRSFWILPLLSNLGYDFQYLKTTEDLNGKSFWINNRDNNLGGFPLFMAGCNESLDKRAENKQLRVSPHALVQEYLNYSEHLYGLVTNGRQLRLLRDASRITRLSYVEFNLEKMMEEDLYSDFVIFYRVLHASRMPQKQDAGAESIIERYHQEGLEAGATIRSKLGHAVKKTIESLANGFLNHPDNVNLREVADNGRLNADEYYKHQLRIIYRLLFLFVIEERNLVYADNKTAETKRFNEIYYKHYSLLRLRKFAKRIPPPEAQRHYDLWQSLLSTFALFEKKEIGDKMGIMALQGDLFSYDALQCSEYDLHECRLSNAVLLDILKSLGYFENESKVLIAVNYGGLDVEEFGSVYEGLLELNLKIEPIANSHLYSCKPISSSERSSSGSHYTPEELVQPLIKHSLEYLIQDKLKEKDPVAGLLSLKVCDVACGSGHILLSAARRIALEVARVQTKEEQPNPLSVRKAMKQVIRKCIYGVDKNPLAIELCKVALWLEAHNPGEPLNFLDHHIKCGDAIVGLAYQQELENGIPDEAFKTLPGDNKTIASAYLKSNKQERKQKSQLTLELNEAIKEEVNAALTKFKIFENLPEQTIDDIRLRERQHREYENDPHRVRLKQLADVQVSQFFIPKTEDEKNYLLTDAGYRKYMRQASKHLGILSGLPFAKADTLAIEKRFFHWFLEFPDVFEEGGFDCILGNPPFLGGQKLSGTYGDPFLEYIKYQFAPIGAVDLVTYFFRRIFTLLKPRGFQSLISTNTIAQGKAREDGLDIIVKNGGSINHAIKSTKWPGVAAVEVALVTITKQGWKGKYILANKEVKTITPYLDDSEVMGNPFPLKQNAGKSFQGSIVLGKGFVLTPEEAQILIAKDPRNKDVLFPYLNGDDLNNDPEQKPSRWVINFFDWSEEKARTYPDCFEIVERLVKPERMKLDESKSTTNKSRKTNWWKFGADAKSLYKTISKLDQVMVISEVTKYVSFVFTPIDIVFMHTTKIIAWSDLDSLALLNSSLYCEWAWKYSSTMGSGTLRYTPSASFETFPFAKMTNDQIQLSVAGKNFYSTREKMMQQLQLGLTRIYNLFHDKELRQISEKDYGLEDGSFEKAYGKTALQLKKHLRNIGKVDYNGIIEELERLRSLLIKIDESIMVLYDWTDLQLRHGFYELEYLPERDRVRFTVHPETRKEILKRLLLLNHQMYSAEAAKSNLDNSTSQVNPKINENSYPKLF